MSNRSNKAKNTVNQTYEEEYKKIINSSNNSVIIKAEWISIGDNFQKLTMYDNNYTSIPTLGETTLIKSF